MLMLVNPKNVCFDNSMFESASFGLVLDSSDELYILDTDDMTVERISYDDLYTYIVNNIIVLENVDLINNRLQTCANGWCMCDLSTVKCKSTLDGSIEVDLSNRVSINGKPFNLRFDFVNSRHVLLLNEKLLCHFEIDGFTYSMGLAYLYRLYDKVIIRMTVKTAGERYLFTVIANIDGDYVGLIVSDNVERIWNKKPNADNASVTKFLSMKRGY